MYKKRRSPAPSFQVPPPFNPLTGRHVGLSSDVDLSRVAVFQVTAISANYLTCKGYDPEADAFLSAVSVAKPYALRVYPWDGATVEFPDYTADYAYTSNTKRTVTIDAGESSEQEYVEELTPPYWKGELLVCAKCLTRVGENAGVPTIPGADQPDEATILTPFIDDGSKAVQWIDLNVAGRAWGSRSGARIVVGLLSQHAITAAAGANHDGHMDGLTTLAGAEVTESEIDVKNTFSWDADENAVAMAIWNPSEGQWELFQVEC